MMPFQAMRFRQPVSSGGVAPVLQSVTPSTAASATVHNATMPATVNAGDMLIIAIVKRSSGTASITNLSSPWATLFNATAINSGTTCRAAIFWKIADGTEGGTSVAITIGSSTAASVAHALRITGASGTPASANSISVGTLNHDPPNLVSGLASPLLWIAGTCGQGTYNVTTWPTGFTTLQTRTPGPSSQAQMITCAMTDPATTVDPTAVVASGGGDARDFTIAVSA